MTEIPLRQAKVFYQDKFAGTLSETKNGYAFIYDGAYLKNGKPIAITLPLQAQAFESENLFLFFQGLLPEGWFLDIVRETAKIDRKDLFGLLLATGQDTIGAVSVIEEKEAKSHD
jgi:serine/threonine-protein kinase HipA